MYNSVNLIILKLFALILAMIAPEFAHAYVAYKMGDNTAKLAGRLTFNPIKHIDPIGTIILPLFSLISGGIIFGYAKPVPVNFARLRETRKGILLVSAAGVTVNLILAMIAGILLQSASLWPTSGFMGAASSDLLAFLGFSIIINVVLAVFNLIPIPPLDGSRILALYLPRDIQLSYIKLERYGMLIILLLLMTGILGKILGFFVWPLINIFLGKYLPLIVKLFFL